MRPDAMPLPDAARSGDGSPGWLRTVAYVGTWLAALLYTAPPEAVTLLPFFPLGLFAPVFKEGSGAGFSVPLLLLIWVPYALHGYYYFRARRRLAVWVLYAVLAAVLSLNVSGCHRVLETVTLGF